MMMRAIIFLLALAASGIGTANDRSAGERDLLAAAEQAYAAGDHQLALQLYDSVLTRSTSAGLQYNIGNCYFKLNDIPRAILHYERALELSPGDDDIRANLELARQQIVDKVNEIPRFSLVDTVGGLLGGSDPDQWAWRAIWIWAITIALLIAGIHAAHLVWKRILLLLSAVLAIGTIASISFAYASYKHLNDDSEAIVLAPVLDVRSEPNAGSTTLFVIHKGTKITVIQNGPEWHEVRLLNGSVGWIPAGTFERI